MVQYLSKDVRDRMGIYKQINEVPDEHRIDRLESNFATDDLWDRFTENHPQSPLSEAKQAHVRKAGRRWREFMENRPRHYGAATPVDVEVYVTELLDSGSSMGNVYNPYWLEVRRFYDWMMWNSDFPHRYNPTLMACAADGNAGKVWNHIVNIEI